MINDDNAVIGDMSDGDLEEYMKNHMYEYLDDIITHAAELMNGTIFIDDDVKQVERVIETAKRIKNPSNTSKSHKKDAFDYAMEILH